jgi:hypothetical protein
MERTGIKTENARTPDDRPAAFRGDVAISRNGFGRPVPTSSGPLVAPVHPNRRDTDVRPYWDGPDSELPRHVHSITSSARASRIGGIVKSIAFAAV